MISFPLNIFPHEINLSSVLGLYAFLFTQHCYNRFATDSKSNCKRLGFCLPMCNSSLLVFNRKLKWLYLSHFLLQRLEIWHDDSLDGIDQAQSQKNFKLRLEASITYYVSQYVFPIYLSHFSSEWTEILHDDPLDGMDRAKIQKKF